MWVQLQQCHVIHHQLHETPTGDLPYSHGKPRGFPALYKCKPTGINRAVGRNQCCGNRGIPASPKPMQASNLDWPQPAGCKQFYIGRSYSRLRTALRVNELVNFYASLLPRTSFCCRCFRCYWTTLTVGCGCVLLVVTSMPVNLLSPHNISNSSMLSNVHRVNLPAVVVTASPHIALPLAAQRVTAPNGKSSFVFVPLLLNSV